MRALLSLLLIGMTMLLSACTSVVFPEPLGKPVPESDELEKFLVGEWLGEKGVIWTVGKDPASEYFIARSTKGDSPERFIVRVLGKETHIMWVENTKAHGYIPLRMAGAEDAVALLYPDHAAVEKMITDGKLQGVKNKETDAWMIAKGDWEEVLLGKEFWLLDNCQPFVRRPQPPKPPETTAVAPPASEAPLPPVKAPSAPSK